MDASTCLLEGETGQALQPSGEPVDFRKEEPGPAARRGCLRGHRNLPRALVVGGAVMLILGTAGLLIRANDEPTSSRPFLGSAAAGRPQGKQTVSVHTTTYQPRERSEWHSHPGVHVVAVVAGSLTVYDSSCQPRVYGSGEAYVGGDSPHMTENQTDEPVQMVVTNVLDMTAAPSRTTLPAIGASSCGQEAGIFGTP